MRASAPDSLFEHLHRGDLEALVRAWRMLPDLRGLAAEMGDPARLDQHAFDDFAQRFRATREYAAYLLHALGGIDARSNGPPSSIEATVEQLEPWLRKAPADRLRWIERARSVSEGVRELLWLLLIELKNAGHPRWIADAVWSDTALDDTLRVNLLAFSVRGANYRLTAEGAAREDGAHDTEPQVQFGWTDEDASKIDWREALDPRDVAATLTSGPTPLKSFASIEEFYTLQMLEPVVAFRKEAAAWRQASVNGLPPERWQVQLLGLGVAQAAINSVQRYYEFLVNTMLPDYPAQSASDLLLSLAFSVVPRELTTDHARRAATVFAKVNLQAPGRALALSEAELHGVLRGVWSRVGQLKVPLLKRIAADVIEATNDKSDRLAMQAGLFEDMRLRMREITRAAVQLEQKARVLNRQLAGSSEDMELPYRRVAELFDESEQIRSPYYGVIAMRHGGAYPNRDQSRWVLCAALSDLLGEPREIDATTLGVAADTAAWRFLANPANQLGVRIDSLIGHMRGPRTLWSADHIAALLMPADDADHTPSLPDDDLRYERFRQMLLDMPAEALSRLKQRFFELGRLGDGRDIQLHVLLPQVPVCKARDVRWDERLCHTGAFVKPSALPTFLSAMYEKTMQRAIAYQHPMRQSRDNRLRIVRDGARWEFEFPPQGNFAFLAPAQFAALLKNHRRLDELATNEEARGDQLRPFVDLLEALDPRYRRDALNVGVDGDALRIQVTHGDVTSRQRLTLWIRKERIHLLQERAA